MSSIKTTQIDGDVSVGRNVATGGKVSVAGDVRVGHNLKVDGWLEAPNVKGVNKGIYSDVSQLRAAYPTPHDGWVAGVGIGTPFAAYVGHGGDWVATGGEINVVFDSASYDAALSALETATTDNAAQILANTRQVVMNAEPYLNTTGASVTVDGVTVPGRSLYIPASATANIFVSGNGAQFQSKAQVLSLEGYGTWCVVFDTATGEFEAVRWYLMGNMSEGKYLWAVISPFAARSVLHINSWRYNIDGTVYVRQMPEALPATVASLASALASLESALANLRIDEAAKNRLQDAAIATNTANIESNTAQILQNTGQAVFLGIPTIDLTAKTITFPSEGVVLYNVGRATAYTLQTTQVVNLGNDWMWKTIVWNDKNKVFEAANGSELRNLAEGQYEYAIIRSIPEWGVLRINSWRYVVDGTEYRQDMPSALPTTVASHGTALESLTQAMTGVQADVTGVQADVAAVRKLPMTTGRDTTAVGEEVAFMSDDERETYAKITPEGIFGKAFFTIDGERVATKNRSIKVLCFGNSFTEDSMSYVPAMLKNVAPELDFVIGMAVKGGCSLAQHCANFTGEAQTLDGETVAVKDNYTYSKFTHNDTSWNTPSSEKTVDYMLADEDWDVVTFQQNGAAAYKDWAIYFAPFIYKLHKALYDKAGVNGKTVKIGWLLTQGAYAADSSVLLNHWQGTATNSKKVLDETATEVVLPFGTAVQNLRTTSLAAAGVGGQYADFRADGTGHLHEGIGTMTANYCNLLAVLKLAGFENVSIIGEPTRVTIAWNTANGTRNPNYKDPDTTAEPTVYGVTDANVYAAQVAAIMAMKKPYEVTDCSAFVGSQS